MTYDVVFSARAEAQLVQIYRYIARNGSPAAAERFTTSIIDYCEGFATFPMRGASRDDLRQGLRTIGFSRSVTIAFAVSAQRVTIVGIFYGGQKLESTIKT